MCFYPITLANGVKAKCRNCWGCRMERQQSLIYRFTKELEKAYKKGKGATFATYTYDQMHLPIGGKILIDKYRNIDIKATGTLVKEDGRMIISEMKKLLDKKENIGYNEWKYIQAGEYGDDGRPHYHFVIIGVDMETWAKHSRTVWTKGIQQIEVLQGTAGINYVSKYFSTAIYGKKRNEIYEQNGFIAPYITTSKNVGEMTDEEARHIIDNNLCYTHNNRQIPIPRNYREKLKSLYGARFDVYEMQKRDILMARKEGYSNVNDYTDTRNWVNEYSGIQISRRKGNGERTTYATRPPKKETFARNKILAQAATTSPQEPDKELTDEK